jgi:hypothetical protein
MADKFIKAIRVRPRKYDKNFGVDLKISIYETGFLGKKRLVKIDEGYVAVTEKQKVYDGLDNPLMPGDDGILLDFLLFIIKQLETPENETNWGYLYTDLNFMDGLGTKGYSAVGEMDKVLAKQRKFDGYPYFEIVEDNYTPGYSPKLRNYGFDEYYLNNGAKIQVKWQRKSYTEGGTRYSDNWGREVDVNDDYDKSVYDFLKSVDVIPPDGKGLITFAKGDKFVSGFSEQNLFFTVNPAQASFYGTSARSADKFSDLTIIDYVLSVWNKLYTDGKKVALVDKPNVTDVPYKDPTKTDTSQVTPVNEDTKPSEVSGVTQEVTKLPIRISIADSKISITAKTDLPEFFVFIGEEQLEGDGISDYDTLDPEYTEGAYVGEPDNVPEFPEEYLKMPDEPDEYKNWKPPGVPTSSDDASGIDTAGTTINDIKTPVIARSMTKLSASSEKQIKSYHQLTLIREKTSSKGTTGTLYFNNKAIAVTCEHPYISAKEKPHTGTKENENSRCIEHGTYPLSLDSTSKSWLAKHYVKFPDSEKAVERNGVLPRINSVPGQSGIRIHAGGSKKDSLGCVLVSNNSTGEGRQVCEMETTKYITKIIYQYKIKEIKIIDEFLNGSA